MPDPYKLLLIVGLAWLSGFSVGVNVTNIFWLRGNLKALKENNHA